MPTIFYHIRLGIIAHSHKGLSERRIPSQHESENRNRPSDHGRTVSAVESTSDYESLALRDRQKLLSPRHRGAYKQNLPKELFIANSNAQFLKVQSNFIKH